MKRSRATRSGNCTVAQDQACDAALLLGRTLYALSEVSIYSAIVGGLEERGCRSTTINYSRHSECIDEAHHDGTIAGRVLANLDR